MAADTGNPINAARALPTSNRLPDVLEFMQVLWVLVHALDTTSKRMAHALGVTGPQRLVLRVVGLFPGLSAGQLAAILHVHPSTLTGILQRLASAGLLVRIHDRQDRRRAVLRLTPQGLKANRLTHGTVEAAISLAVARTSDADRQATMRVLSEVARRLNGASPRREARRGDPGRRTAEKSR